MLSVKNLKKEYGKFKIDKVSFSVERGKITGLIGNNGAGKTTVLKCVIGVLHYDFGEIIIDGLMLGHHEEEYKEKIGIVFDSGYFYENLTLEEMKKIISAAYRNWDEEVYQGRTNEWFRPKNTTIILQRNDRSKKARKNYFVFYAYHIRSG